MRTLCEKCKQPYSATAQEYILRHYGEEHFQELNIVPDSLTICRAAGCQACGKTGYKSRMGIYWRAARKSGA